MAVKGGFVFVFFGGVGSCTSSEKTDTEKKIIQKEKKPHKAANQRLTMCVVR